MQIIEKRLDEIHPYENNPRKNDSAVKYVAASIREFGFKVPIVIEAGGEIVAGHTRYKAAQELGLKTVPCVVADDLTPQQIKAFRLADNKTAEMAGWDFEALDFELEGVGDLDMGLFGFEDDIGAYDFSDLDTENDSMAGKETDVIKLSVPKEHIDEVKKWLANGEKTTAVGMGLGVLKRCGLL